jgi:hypothetical protein
MARVPMQVVVITCALETPKRLVMTVDCRSNIAAPQPSVLPHELALVLGKLLERRICVHEFCSVAILLVNHFAEVELEASFQHASD